MLEDRVIIDQVINGDDDAFRILVKRHESRIASVIYNMVGFIPEAEDIGQEVFICFYKTIDRFRSESSLATYLTRIAINLSLNELKKQKMKRKWFINDPEVQLDMADSNSGYTENIDKEMIQLAIKKLDPKFRSVIVLRLMEGYSTGETAEILGLPLGTVLSRLARGQKKLKELLSPYREVIYG